MFTGAEIPLTVGFDDARARLATLIRGGLLRRASGCAFDIWSTALARDGQLGTAPWGTALGMSRLARVQFLDTAAQPDLAVWPLRWEVTGPHGGLVPVLDADIRLTPVRADATLLAVLAVCRPPSGVLAASSDQEILRRCATAMIQALTDQIGTAVTRHAASASTRRDGTVPEAWPEPETP